MKKIFIVISIMFLFIGKGEIIKGEEIEFGKEVGIHKIWTIEFNKEINEADFNSSGIRIMDDKGGVLISSTKVQGNYVNVYPVDGYEYGKKYQLFIGKNINQKENLKEEIIMNFTTKSLFDSELFDECFKQGTLKGNISMENGNLIIDGNEVESNLRLDKNELVYKIMDLFLQENCYNNQLEVTRDDIKTEIVLSKRERFCSFEIVTNDLLKTEIVLTLNKTKSPWRFKTEKKHYMEKLEKCMRYISKSDNYYEKYDEEISEQLFDLIDEYIFKNGYNTTFEKEFKNIKVYVVNNDDILKIDFIINDRIMND
ncbi:hypothetical protein [Oceanirhabdus sp. W0125-5]|uniref:hypothetical protein n=1 Tax=Oceanirhabdus sp. W0125-5 TaxID=2999116 RepID=UPI0022F2D1D0|nr:hypothetical protein [Oceanirhabdus sp. W0125-5]WBW98168.1 hypothetical protein OW730_05220 [Oceanirhabdus sp. W0125-5]